MVVVAQPSSNNGVAPGRADILYAFENAHAQSEIALEFGHIGPV
jgi:hypothetical protein